MTNGEWRMTKEIRNPNDEIHEKSDIRTPKVRRFAISDVAIRVCFIFSYS